MRQLRLRGTKIGPRRGSEPGVKGRANGSPGTEIRWKHGPAFLAQFDTCVGREEGGIKERDLSIIGPNDDFFKQKLYIVRTEIS